MGIFDSKHEFAAQSVTNKALGTFDDPLPGIIGGAIVTGADITKTVVDYKNNGMYRKSEAFYQYGRDHYSRGLPKQNVRQKDQYYTEIKRIIETAIGQKIDIDYLLIEDTSSEHAVQQYLQDVRHMNYTTKVIGINPPGASGSHTYIDSTFSTDKSSVVIHYSGSVNETYAITDFDEYKYQVRYYVLNSSYVRTGDPVFWTYIRTTGTYPILDSQADTNSGLGVSPYYPIVSFYEDRTQIGDPDNAGTPLYDTSRKLVKKLGLDYESIVEQLAAGTGDSIGSDKGLYAYMYFGAEVTAGIHKNPTATTAEKLALTTEAQPTLNYLFEFFKMLDESIVDDRKILDELLNSKDWLAFGIKSLSLTDTTFRAMYQYWHIDTTTHTGVIGDVGWCDSSFEAHDRTFYLVESDGIKSNIDGSILTYRRQETDTTYVKIEVYGLQQKFLLFENKDASTRVFDSFRGPGSVGGEDPFFITIPLNRDIVKKLPQSMRNRLMHASLCFTFNAYQTLEIEWYQTGPWVLVFQIILMYLSMPSGGATMSISNLFTLAGLKAAAYALLMAIVKYIVTSEIVKYVAKQFGADVAYIIAVVMIIYGSVGKGQGGVKGAPFAEQLLSIGNTMWGTTNKLVQDTYKNIQEDYAKLKSETDRLNDELEVAKRLLDKGMDIDPWLFVNPLPDLMFSQNASQFIDTRKGNLNPGVLSLTAPSVYVELMLRLPTIDDTLTK